MLARSVLFLPASNPRAIEKARTLACDLAVLDLEDAVAPEEKDAARIAAVKTVRGGGFSPDVGVRVNGLDTPWGEADLRGIAASGVRLIVAPKVESGDQARAYAERLPDGCALWAMIETPGAVLRLAEIASAGGPLAGLMLGVNDLAAGLRTGPSPDREPLKPWMAAVVAAARANGLLAIDGVFNRLDDASGHAAECREGRLYGFDGKSLIHPSQIAAANAAFSPTADELEEARALVAAFASPESDGKGAIRVDGRMAERLHLQAAEALLERQRRIEARG